MLKKIKNAAEVAKTWCGMEIQSGAYYEIQSAEELRWANDSALLVDIAAGVAVVNNGVDDIADVNTAINYLKNDLPTSISVSSTPPFADKTMVIAGVTKKLYARTVGIQAALSVGANTITYTATFPWVKITGIEAINCEALDTAHFKVYDTAAGTYSGYPNALLNQFGYSVNLPKDFYKRIADFDADLYIGMVIKVEYVSISEKTVGLNLIMNEVK